MEVPCENELRSQAAQMGTGSVRKLFSGLFSDRNAAGVLEELLMRTICSHIACMTDSCAKKTYEALYG